MSDPEAFTPAQPQPQAESFEYCEQCHAPVDHLQRYCVNCGNHRRHVPDPAAQYLSRVSPGARPGAVTGADAAPRAADRGAGIGWLGALALALIPVAAAVGVAIGRSSNNEDGKLLQAYEHQRMQVTTTEVVAAGPAGTSASSGAATTTPATHTTPAAKRRTATTAGASTGASSSTTVAKVTGTRVTAAQQAQGSSDAKKVQNSTGKNYVQANNNLPDTVVVGP